jgi:CTP synthase
MKKHYVIVTGGVLSGVGKGILSASIARLMKESGVRVNTLKIDPYLNIDAGTMNPNQHGEVFVTEDGYEADLDLGHYERFLGVDMRRHNNLTAGQIYKSVIDKEREGKYLGSTVQIVPHVTDEIKQRISDLDGELIIIEIGGTVGDIEGEVFLEAVREMTLENDKENFLFVHVTYAPHLEVTDEFKTKPTQQSVQLLRRIGIQPDMIVVRSQFPVEEQDIEKIALFGGVARSMVFNFPDIENVYEAPAILHSYGVHHKIASRLNMKTDGQFNWEYPRTFASKKVALIGKYLGTGDSYKSIIESVVLCGNDKPEILDSQSLEGLSPEELDLILRKYEALIIPGGFGKRGIEGKLAAIRYARENNVPILGICLGMQLMIIEFARNVQNLTQADSTEFRFKTPYPVVDIMEDQKKLLMMGGTMRLGAQKAKIFRETNLFSIYETDEIWERHRHRFEVNRELASPFLCYPGQNCSGKLTVCAEEDFIEAIELQEHSFFIGVQFHPEFRSKVGLPHPLFKALLDA